jgi:NADH-ubiquinone oxidoreductase chain 5
VFYIGVITCLIASLSAIYENDLKKVVALSTLSQLGVMMIALGLGLPMLAFFHLITHALFKALLFVCAGTIIHNRINNQDIRLMGNIWFSIPVTCTSLNAANLALCGFPFMAGFYSKDAIVESFIVASFPITTRVLIFLSVCLTGAYSIRLSLLTLWSPHKGSRVIMVKDESIYTYLSFSVLLLGAVFGGSVCNWILFPSAVLMVLPLQFKLLTLGFLSTVAVCSYFLVCNSYV